MHESFFPFREVPPPSCRAPLRRDSIAGNAEPKCVARSVKMTTRIDCNFARGLEHDKSGHKYLCSFMRLVAPTVGASIETLSSQP